jgi:signal transduction histidine kinase
MVRRGLPLLVLLAGLAALLAGVVSLERVFLREREDALDALADQQAALESYAVTDVQERCRDELEAQRSRRESALRDPLIDASGLVYLQAGRQLLPRQFAFLDEASTQASHLYDQLMTGDLPTEDLEEDDPWLERLRYFSSFRDAVENGNRDAIERNFRVILTHRTRFVIHFTRDLTSLLAALDLLERKSGADPALMQMILRDGFTDSRGTHTPGVQTLVLQRREKLTREDFDFLAARIQELSEGSGVPHGDFRRRVMEPSAPTVELPEPVGVPTLLERGAWYVQPLGTGVVEGVAIDLGAILAGTRAEMQGRGLLDDGDTLSLVELVSHPQPFTTLRVTVDSPRWQRSRAATERRFWLKTGLALTLFALIAGGSVLRSAWTRRERQLVALKSDFVATVSHELRTPLASMRLMAETLKRRLDGVDLARDYPERLIREIDSLNFLVENILSFNRLEKGRFEPHVEDVRLPDIVRALEQELQGATRVRVAVRFEGANDVVLRADPELMRLLFLNLGTNACKYNEDDPVTIRIEVEVGRPTLVRMIDNGIGIPGDEREKVFSEFYRADERGRGFGLGLAICRRIMELHAGQIRVADSSTNGTVFEMSFP